MLPQYVTVVGRVQPVLTMFRRIVCIVRWEPFSFPIFASSARVLLKLTVEIGTIGFHTLGSRSVIGTLVGHGLSRWFVGITQP